MQLINIGKPHLGPLIFSDYELGLGYHIYKNVSLELDLGYYKYDQVSTNDGSVVNFGNYGISADTRSIGLQIKYSWY